MQLLCILGIVIHEWGGALLSLATSDNRKCMLSQVLSVLMIAWCVCVCANVGQPTWLSICLSFCLYVCLAVCLQISTRTVFADMQVLCILGIVVWMAEVVPFVTSAHATWIGSQVDQFLWLVGVVVHALVWGSMPSCTSVYMSLWLSFCLSACPCVCLPALSA